MSSSDDEDSQDAAGGSGSKWPSPQSILPSAKRQRKQSLQPGQIIKVKMHNFMTYADATIVPGARLNLVLGPNGTGKSSLVNALCLGLGGKTTLLGRADKVSEFVRKGTSKGYTEITLSRGEGQRPLLIKRELNSSDNSSSWLMNNAPKTMTEVVAAVADLKIQVDNLCQFLPQDKVVMFARLTPTELLKETEKAIGSGELYEIHKQLMEKKQAQNDIAQSRGVVEAELTRHKAANAAMERDVARFQEREGILKKVEILEKKLPWVRYKEAKDAYLDCKNKKETAERQLQQRKDDLAAQQGPLKERQRQLGKALDAKKKARREVLSMEQRMTGHWETANSMTDQIDVDRENIENLEEDVAAAEQRIEAITKKIDDYEKQIADMPAPPQREGHREKELRAELVDLNTQERSRRTEMDGLRDESRGVQQSIERLQRRLRELDSVKGQRLAALEQRNHGLAEAAKWVQDNQGEFRGKVYGPVICEVEVEDPQYAAMLEQHVPMAQWLVFVTETREDQDHLIKLSRDRKWRFKPSVSCYSDNAAAPIPHPKGHASQYSRFGVEKTLDEVFEAPSLVKHNLKDEANIHETYILGGSEVDAGERIEQFQQASGARVVWAHGNQFRVQVSAYNSAARSQTVVPLRPPRFLKAGATGGAERAQVVAQLEENQQALQELNRQLQEAQQAHAAAQERQRKTADDMKAIRDARAKYDKRKRDLETRLRAEQRGLEKERAKPNPRDQEPQLRQKLESTVTRAADAATKAAKAVTDMWAALREEAHRSLAWQQLDLIVGALRKVTEGQVDAVRNYEALVRRVVTVFEDAQEALRRKKELAEEKAGEMTTELKTLFRGVEDYGSTADDINSSIATLGGEADGIVCSNPRVMEEYKDRAKKIVDLETKLEDEQARLETRVAEIAALEERWLPELQRIVATINKTFGLAFAKIGCAGEVVLHRDEDYNKCAINIKVKFREAEELQVLNAQRQSGGERSVSTILYLVALQNVAACPFRVVDEINQGMDPYNERKVFLELVSAATEEGTPQCFLLTPKLLPDLPFSAAVTVLQIMNGPQIGSVARGFTQDVLLGNRARLVSAH